MTIDTINDARDWAATIIRACDEYQEKGKSPKLAFGDALEAAIVLIELHCAANSQSWRLGQAKSLIKAEHTSHTKEIISEAMQMWRRG